MSTTAKNGAMFSTEIVGVIPKMLELIMSSRKTDKEEMIKLEQEFQMTKDDTLLPRISALFNSQQAKKIASNSLFGAFGQEGFHYYDKRMAEAITLTGQHIIKEVSAAINLKVNSILETNNIVYDTYQDTDSCYVNVQPIVDKFFKDKLVDKTVLFLDEFSNKIIQPVIDKTLLKIGEESNCINHVLGMKREAIASKVLYRAKKNYAMYVHNSEGVSYNPPKLKIMGIEVVRSSTPQWCRNNLKKSIQMIFESDEDTLRKKFVELEKEYKTLSADEIGCPKGVSDITKHYVNGKRTNSTSVPMHVRAAYNYNQLAKDIPSLQHLTNGDKIKYVYLKTPNPIQQNIIGFPSHMKLPKEFGLDKYIDYDLQFLKTFQSPLESLTNPAGWKLIEVSSLEDFFG